MVVKREKSIGMEVGESIEKRVATTLESRDADRCVVPASLRDSVEATLPDSLPAET